MSRLSAFLHRIMDRYDHVFEDVRDNVIEPIVEEIKAAGGRMTTDEQRRDICKRVIKEYIALKYPGYSWVVNRIVDSIFLLVRAELKKRRVG